MISFSGRYYNGSFIYDKDMEVIRQSLLIEMNTLKGYRPYLPDYGTSISSYEFSLNNQSLISRVFNEMKRVIENHDNIVVNDYSYEIDSRSIKYQFIVKMNSNKYVLNFTYSSGVVS